MAACQQNPFFQHRLCTLHAQNHETDIDRFERFHVGDFCLGTAVGIPLFSIPKGISLEHPDTTPALENPLTNGWMPSRRGLSSGEAGLSADWQQERPIETWYELDSAAEWLLVATATARGGGAAGPGRHCGPSERGWAGAGHGPDYKMCLCVRSTSLRKTTKLPVLPAAKAFRKELRPCGSYNAAEIVLMMCWFPFI